MEPELVLPAKNFLPYVAILPWGTRRNYPQQVESTCATPVTGPANDGAKLGQFGRDWRLGKRAKEHSN